jgi:hypothetical protein
MHVTRQPIEFRDDDRAAGLFRRLDGRGKLGTAFEGVGTFAGFALLVARGDLEALGLGESLDGVALSGQTVPALGLPLRRDPDVSDGNGGFRVCADLCFVTGLNKGCFGPSRWILTHRVLRRFGADPLPACAGDPAADARPSSLDARSLPTGYVPAMTNAFGVVLDSASLRWAAAEGVPETVIAAVLLLENGSIDEIVAKLGPRELEQVIKLVGRSPWCYPPGTARRRLR